MMNDEVTVFENEVLSDEPDMVDRCVSPAFEVQGNTLRLSLLLKNLTSGGRLHMIAEGSYDGRSWWTTGLSGLSILNVMSAPTTTPSPSAVQTTYAWIRVRAWVTGGPGISALFSTTAVFTHQ